MNNRSSFFPWCSRDKAALHETIWPVRLSFLQLNKPSFLCRPAVFREYLLDEQRSPSFRLLNDSSTSSVKSCLRYSLSFLPFWSSKETSFLSSQTILFLRHSFSKDFSRVQRDNFTLLEKEPLYLWNISNWKFPFVSLKLSEYLLSELALSLYLLANCKLYPQ